MNQSLKAPCVAQKTFPDNDIDFWLYNWKDKGQNLFEIISFYKQALEPGNNFIFCCDLIRLWINHWRLHVLNKKLYRITILIFDCITERIKAKPVWNIFLYKQALEPDNNIKFWLWLDSIMNQSLKALKAPCVAQKTLPG